MDGHELLWSICNVPRNLPRLTPHECLLSTIIHAASTCFGVLRLISSTGNKGSRTNRSSYRDRIAEQIEAAALTKPELVIFDCDGVLVDSEILSCRIEAELFQQVGLSISIEEIITRFVGLDYDTMAQQISSDYGVQLPDEFESCCLKRFSREMETELDAVAGIADMLDGMLYPICLASSSPLTRIEKSLAVTGLTGYFSGRIFSAQMVSRGKPAPDLFLLAAAKCAAAPAKCLVIEDSVHGIKAAVAAGMSCVGFTAGSHCSATQEDALTAAGAHLLATDAGQLVSILNAFRPIRA